ncbi:hypothetical protein NDU88_002005 [Pleurodeles waltl]|uniref:Uncharacterized protein n=1 Tax=Pleurodeles waltl TaxID=8319 RepID=A0AAV7NHC7_PLEWA|nr:hypothetical protein NDU88_002005 [Pleurodeles waltl]
MRPEVQRPGAIVCRPLNCGAACSGTASPEERSGGQKAMDREFKWQPARPELVALHGRVWMAECRCPSGPE